MPSRKLVSSCAAVLLIFGLSACQPGLLAVPDEVEVPGQQQPGETTPTASEGEPDEAPSQAPVEQGDALDVTCEQVFTLEQLYEFDANFTPVDNLERDLPPVFETIADADGTVCAFSHVTSDQVLVIGVAPRDTDLGDDEGYTNEVGIGTVAEQFAGYVIAVGSTYFGDPSDADNLIDTVAVNVSDALD